jgi:outer membrane protein W
MIKVISILVVLITLPAFGQQNDSLKFNNLKLGLSISPSFSSRYLKAESDAQANLDYYDSIELPHLGYSIGLNLGYQISKRFSINSGLFFANRAQSSKSASLASISNFTNNIYYLDLPLKFNYYLLSKKSKLYLTGGANFSYFLANNVSYRKESNNEVLSSKGDDLNSINIAGIIGIGIDVPIYKRWAFNFEVNYQHAFTPLLNTPIERYLYSFNPTISLFYRF